MRSFKLFIQLLIFLRWNIHANGQYPNWEQMNAFIIDMRYARFIRCATLVGAFSSCEVFLHKEAAWSLERKLLLKRIASCFWFELLLIVSFLTLILILPVVFTSRWHLSGCTLRCAWKPVKKDIYIFFKQHHNIF